MKIKKLLSFLLLTGAFCISAADVRIGVVDLEKVFQEYYKSKIAEDTIRKQGEVYRTYLLKLNEQYQQLQQEASKLLMNSQNIALSNEERQRSIAAAEEKRRELQQKKAEIDLYAKERTQDLRQLEDKKRGEITDEIKAAVKRRAEAEKIDFVFDCSGKTLNQQPALLYFPPHTDLTNKIITELNRRATEKNPPETTK